MVSSINSLLAQSLFGSGSSSTGIDSSLLTSWAAAKAGIGVQVQDAGMDPNRPYAEVWSPGFTPSAEALWTRALAGKSFFDPKAQLFTDLGATGDYRNLFALHTGLSTMNALASRLEDEKLPAVEKRKTEAQFARGLEELQAFFGTQKFEDIRLAQGDRVDEAKTTLAIPSTSDDYITPVMHKGSLADKVSGLDPNAKFDIVAQTSGGTTKTVTIDLATMGSVPRSLGNLVSFINQKLTTAGVSSRFEAVNQTPKTTTLVVAGKAIERPYTGPRQYALKVDVRANETITFNAASTEPAFYVVGSTTSGARLVKLSDTGGDPGQPTMLTRPGATTDPIGADVSEGWYGPDTAPTNALEKRSNALVGDDDTNSYETKLREAGEATLKLELADGRTITVSTAWRSDDLEAWRTRAGESEDRAILDDLAERLTQLLHEQGVAAGVDVWQDGVETDQMGLSIFTADGVNATTLSISGKNTLLTPQEVPGMVGGLREGVFARRYEAANVAATTATFYGKQSFTFTTTKMAQTISIDAGEDGMDAATILTKLNENMRLNGLAASAALVDDGGTLTFRVDALHDMLDVSASLQTDPEDDPTTHDANLLTPGAWAQGGLPVAGAGQPFGDAVRTWNVSGGSPLIANSGALDIQVVVATATGNKTVSVQITALERSNDPDPSPGEWSAAFQDRVDTALNAAGVYVDSVGSDLSQWKIAEGSGQRIASISVNGAPLTLTAETPALNKGGAFAVERSFTSAQAATGTADIVNALTLDPTVSITFGTAWGEKTVSATLDPGDARTLESAALRLNEALAAQGYDLGVAATALSGGGAGLRVVTGASHTIRNVEEIKLGADSVSATLDPIDSQVHGLDLGAQRVNVRASRGASASELVPSTSTLGAPSAGASGWFAGRAFDVAIGDGMKVATARAVATGADGSVFVLADLNGDSSTTPIKGARDVALLKYDSAGKLAFSRVLGASEDASGFALAVSADGKVAIAGSVTGALSNAGAAKGGADSFVSVYDKDGAQLWTARRGATANDQVNAVAFAPDGSVIVAGKTESALGPAIALGGSDAYIRGYSAAGFETFTRQYGTGRDDTATALLVRDDGSGGAEIFVGGVEDARGKIRSFTYKSSEGLTAGATRDIGYFFSGGIRALAADGNDLYVGGEVGADRLNVGATMRGAVSGLEGFVARVNTNLVAEGADRATYLGSAQDDSVTGLVVANGSVYAAGTTGGVFAGQGTANTKSSFVARLDDDGALAWSKSFASASGGMSVTGLAADTSGASALDVLALPRGRLDTVDSTKLVDRSALRVGDEFKIGVEGRRATTITITANDTISSLLARINRAIGSGGHAQLVRDNGTDRINITSSTGKAIRLENGRDGRDALGGLGLSPGVIAKNEPGAKNRAFGLGIIGADLKLTDKAAILKTKAEISAALSIVKQAYEAIANPNAKEMTEEEKKLQERRNAIPPANITAQIANYKAALARLGG